MSDVVHEPGDGSAQAAHYDAILDDYDRHYGDAASLEYRRRFFIAPLLQDLDLSGLDVADIASGSGYTTQILKSLFPSARLVGFDVAEEAVKAYGNRTGCDGHVWDLTGAPTSMGPFDVAIVVGGLHHCARAVGTALNNLAALLRPGGTLLLVEPNRDTWFERARRLWYRHDGYFEASTEAALSHPDLIAATTHFDCVFVRYMGGPAYFLVYNSLVFRVPLWLKPYISRPLMTLERFANRLSGTRPFPYFVARWTRRADH